MGSIVSLALASTFSIGPVDFEPPVPVNNPTVRVMEGVFVQSEHEPRVHFFDADAETPPHMERIAVMSRSGVSGRMVRTLRSAENELRLIAERPDSFDIVGADGGLMPEDVVGIINDEEGSPLAFVTSEREGVVGLVLDVPDVGIDVIENFGHSEQPLTVGPGDMVIGIVTINPRGGFNALMDHLNPHEAEMLLEMYRFPQDGQPGQN